jgi:hypothetical protein
MFRRKGDLYTLYVICTTQQPDSPFGHIVPLRWRLRVIFQDPTVPSGLVYWLYVLLTIKSSTELRALT